MPLSIKQKQVLGVTSIVVLVVVVLSVLQLMSLTRALLQQSRHRGELIALTIYHRAQNVVVSAETGVSGPAARSRRARRARVGAVFGERRLRRDRRSMPASSSRTAIRRVLGSGCPAGDDLGALAEASGITQLRAVYQTERMLEWRQPMLLGDTPFADVRVGQSTLLIRETLDRGTQAGGAMPRPSRCSSPSSSRCCSRRSSCGRFTSFAAD